MYGGATRLSVTQGVARFGGQFGLSEFLSGDGATAPRPRDETRSQNGARPEFFAVRSTSTGSRGSLRWPRRENDRDHVLTPRVALVIRSVAASEDETGEEASFYAIAANRRLTSGISLRGTNS